MYGMTVGFTLLGKGDITSVLDALGARFDTPTYAQLVADATAPTIAYCTSDKCCSYYALDRHGYKHHKLRKEAHKDVDKSKNDCPDCGHALLWKKANWVRRM